MVIKRVVLSFIMTAGPWLNVAGHSTAQPYPDKPIKLTVPFPAGGPIDVTARVVGQRRA